MRLRIRRPRGVSGSGLYLALAAGLLAGYYVWLPVFAARYGPGQNLEPVEKEKKRAD